MADTARDPPPDRTDFHEVEDGEDLFPEPSSQPASLSAVDISTNANGPKQDSFFDDDNEDLFAGMNTHRIIITNR
uniref:Sorting nexin N-terminal domain-containing protein n=1 Tax=Xiphophorus couchianus TaxID=32473 RepID=A0A3B5MKY6_9TELE